MTTIDTLFITTSRKIEQKNSDALQNAERRKYHEDLTAQMIRDKREKEVAALLKEAQATWDELSKSILFINYILNLLKGALTRYDKDMIQGKEVSTESLGFEAKAFELLPKEYSEKIIVFASTKEDYSFAFIQRNDNPCGTATQLQGKLLLCKVTYEKSLATFSYNKVSYIPKDENIDKALEAFKRPESTLTFLFQQRGTPQKTETTE